jgi:Ca2+-binding RTX toxin-like protein
MIINVSSGSALTSAVGKATDGDVIQLSSGTYDIDVRNASFTNGVTITSAPGANVVVNNLFAYNDTGLIFKDLELARSATTTRYEVNTSSNITLDGLYVHGSLDDNPANDGNGITVRGSHNVTIENSEFQQLYSGLSHLKDDGLIVRGNYFHQMAMDGMRGGGSSNVTVDQNFFTDFNRDGGAHTDAIQFWTTNEKTSAHDITVTNNVVLGSVGTSMQGVFLGEETGVLPYQNVDISGNMILGSQWNGIYNTNGVNVSVTDNTVVATSSSMSAWIKLASIEGATLSNNVSTSYIWTDNTGVQSNNQTVAIATDGGLSLLNQWLNTHGGDLSSLPQAVWDEIHPTASTLVKGTTGSDALASTGTGNQLIEGGAGADTLTGGQGANILAGGDGNDSYVLGTSGDVVIENDAGGYDTVTTSASLYTMPANVEALKFGGATANGNELNNNMWGSGKAETFRGYQGADTLQGRDGADTLYGGDGNDSLNGGTGNDYIDGGAGNDYIVTSTGDDKVFAGAGADTIMSDYGSDRLEGGDGGDVFIFTQALRAERMSIVDFNPSEGDWISLRSIDANVGVAGNQNFTFIGTAGFSHHAGELRVVNGTGYATIQGDTNGDGLFDLNIVVNGVSTVTPGNILL